MLKSVNLKLLFASLLVSVTSAAASTPENVCHSSAIGVHRGSAFNVSVSTNATCEIAGLYLQGQKSTDLEIGLNQSSCTSIDAKEQFFQVQLSKTAPLGQGQVRFVCDDLIENHCIRFWVEESNSVSTQGFESNEIHGACPPPYSNTVPWNGNQTVAQSRLPILSGSSLQPSAMLPYVTGSVASISTFAGLLSMNATTLSVRLSAGALSPVETPLASQSYARTTAVAVTTPSSLPSPVVISTGSPILPRPNATHSAAVSLASTNSNSLNLTQVCTCE
jgi:hypothetical protein